MLRERDFFCEGAEPDEPSSSRLRVAARPIDALKPNEESMSDETSSPPPDPTHSQHSPVSQLALSGLPSVECSNCRAGSLVATFRVGLSAHLLPFAASLSTPHPRMVHSTPSLFR
ncbi:unnamed protein product [Protopolystoma xenopodis]|uniref:Uncharacterized protein n=1 Tax=Protopolystoma xenopodis TaxID=117903 RepID=A0A448X5S8_9PLAT|nr:unnamed protein product [Protopolystoma xenopodis]